MDKDFEQSIEFDEEEFDVMILEDEETGDSVELVVIDSIDEGTNTYLLVVERDEFDNDCPDASIMREYKDENDEYVYELLEDDEEFERISKYFSDFEDTGFID